VLGRPAQPGIGRLVYTPVHMLPGVIGHDALQESRPVSTMELAETALLGHSLHDNVPFCHGLLLRKPESAERGVFHRRRASFSQKIVNGVAWHPSLLDGNLMVQADRRRALRAEHGAVIHHA